MTAMVLKYYYSDIGFDFQLNIIITYINLDNNLQLIIVHSKHII